MSLRGVLGVAGTGPEAPAPEFSPAKVYLDRYKHYMEAFRQADEHARSIAGPHKKDMESARLERFVYVIKAADVLEEMPGLKLVLKGPRIDKREVGMGVGSNSDVKLHIHLNKERSKGVVLVKKYTKTPDEPGRRYVLNMSAVRQDIADFLRFVTMYSNHPHIKECRLVIDHDGDAPIAKRMTLPILGNIDLEKLDCSGDLGMRRWLKAIATTLQQLAALHDLGIAHLDIKEINIRSQMIDGSSYLIDFGTSLNISDCPSKDCESRTPKCYKPFQALVRAEQLHGFDTDFYSFASVFEMKWADTGQREPEKRLWIPQREMMSAFQCEKISGEYDPQLQERLGAAVRRYEAQREQLFSSMKSGLQSFGMDEPDIGRLIGFFKLMGSQDQSERRSVDIHEASAFFQALSEKHPLIDPSASGSFVFSPSSAGLPSPVGVTSVASADI